MPVLIAKSPDRAPSLMSYMATICKFSKMYRHPSWVLYDQQFRQEAVESGLRDWSKVDGCTHSCCFNGQCLDASPWCSTCKSLEHSAVMCLVRTEAPSTSDTKRQLQGAKRLPKKRPPPASVQKPCRRWNRPGEPDCPFGDGCIYLYICSSCKSPDHPESSCSSRPRKR